MERSTNDAGSYGAQSERVARTNSPAQGRRSADSTPTMRESRTIPPEKGAGATRVLAVDVGNTQTNFGLFCDGALVGRRSLTTHRRLTADEALMEAREVFSTFPRGHEGSPYGSASIHNASATNEPAPWPMKPNATPERVPSPEFGGRRGRPASFTLGAILSCVVPTLTDTWTRALHELCGNRPLVVGPGLKTGLRMRYKDPAEVGPDRIADVMAAKATYGAPVVLVDLGTTTNIEVVDKNGVFVGGLIAPGLRLGANALSQAAARLPMIELRAPHAVIGRTTREAMQSGVVFGEVARIDGLLDAVMGELGYEAPVVLSGNDAQTMAALLKHSTTVDGDLTLRGLWLLWSANTK